MVEGARLESVYTLIRIEGSNPSLSARPKKGPRNAGLFFWSGGERGLMRTLGSTNRESDLDRKLLLHFRHTAHPCALPPQAPLRGPVYPCLSAINHFCVRFIMCGSLSNDLALILD